MKKLFLALVMSMLFASAGFAADKKVTLTPENTISLRDAVSAESVSTFIQALLLNPSDTVFIYINSPGGSVVAGNQLINALEGSGKHTICIAEFAASMAFSILQACDERYYVGGAIIMQHEISFGAEGSLTQVKTQVKLAEALAEKLNKADAARLGMSVEEFQKKIHNEFWMTDDEILKNKASDGKAVLTCSKAMVKGRSIQKVQSIFGEVTLEWSTCPLLTYPISVKFGKSAGTSDKEYMAWVKGLSLDQEYKTRREVK